MKEATGELNMSVIVVTIVAGLTVFFFTYLWPNIRGGFRRDLRCDDAICPCPDQDASGKCRYTGKTVECYMKDDPSKKVVCTWKG